MKIQTSSTGTFPRWTMLHWFQSWRCGGSFWTLGEWHWSGASKVDADFFWRKKPPGWEINLTPNRGWFLRGFPKMESSFRDLEVHERCNLYPKKFWFIDYFTASRQTTLIVYPLSISTIWQLPYLLFLYNLLLGKAGDVPGHKTVAVVVGFWSK